jgi:ElaB/YqjD/DUF883 family membrane-anchored ribosome-binding protein
MNSQTRLLNNTSGHASTDAAVHLAHDLIDRAAQHLGGSEEKLRQNVGAAEVAVKKSLKAARTRGIKTKESAQTVVTRHPLAAIGLALGGGALLTLMLRRRATPIEAMTTATDKA